MDIDIKSELLQADHTLCFADDKPTIDLIKLWKATNQRMASIENFNLRSIILNTLKKRGFDTINGLSKYDPQVTTND